MASRGWWSQTFANDGGPLIALTHEMVGHWPEDRNGYDRACDARYPFDFFQVGPGLVIVINSPWTMIYEANWLRLSRQPGIILVGWDSGAEDEREWLLSRLPRPGLDWHRHRQRMTVASGVLLLQHAAGSAAEVRFAPPDQWACIGQVVPVGIEPGRYALETLSLEEEAGGHYRCVLCRWVPSGRV